MQITKYKVIIVLPAYNEGQAIAKVISGIINAGFNQIIVVNDGSKDNTGSIAKKAGAHVVSHIINRGVGAARFTGNKAALQLGADIIVQMDADGQHDPSDIYKIIKPIIDHRADITIGSRFLSDNKIPSSRRILNWIGNLATMIFFGIWVSDSQTGFKAFSQVAAQKLNTKFDTYEWESEVISEIGKHKFLYFEIPIKIRYTSYSLSKGQSFANGLRMGLRIMWRALFG